MKLSEILYTLYKSDMEAMNITVVEKDGIQRLDKWDDKLGTRPTEKYILSLAPSVQAQYDLNNILLYREMEYPKISDLIIALWEKVVEGRSETADELEILRQAIKTKYPKV